MDFCKKSIFVVQYEIDKAAIDWKKCWTIDRFLYSVYVEYVYSIMNHVRFE